ncbi:hypothetical protein FKW77_006256 [Venturia effusa]|uniref:Uncharacterized protein n=1 Tax=Venturia effusa TaxID=50376 RepID=A0A517LLN6_9PEZI|nr:hypothetical protein FKW77_006256 [Venturia effusa]
MIFFRLIGLFSWSVFCTSIVQGQRHVFIANLTSAAPNGLRSSNASITSNGTSNGTSDANIAFQNLTDLDPFKSRAAAVQNLQSFTGALAGIPAPPIRKSNDKSKPFQVQGDTFSDFAAAGSRTCDVQFAKCSNAANAKNTQKGKRKSSKNKKARSITAAGNLTNTTDSGGPKQNANADTATVPDTSEKAGPNKFAGSHSVAECDAQKTACNAAQKNAPFQSFNFENVGPDPEMPEFDLLCAP